MLKKSKILRSILKTLQPIQMFVCWMLKAPFEMLPPAFGDTVPPELRVFEAEAEEIQHHAVGQVSLPKGHGHERSRAAHRDSFLERDK